MKIHVISSRIYKYDYGICKGLFFIIYSNKNTLFSFYMPCIAILLVITVLLKNQTQILR